MMILARGTGTWKSSIFSKILLESSGTYVRWCSLAIDRSESFRWNRSRLNLKSRECIIERDTCESVWPVILFYFYSVRQRGEKHVRPTAEKSHSLRYCNNDTLSRNLSILEETIENRFPPIIDLSKQRLFLESVSFCNCIIYLIQRISSFFPIKELNFIEFILFNRSTIYLITTDAMKYAFRFQHLHPRWKESAYESGPMLLFHRSILSTRTRLSLSSSHFHRIPDSHSANGSCVRFIPPLEALELRVRSACIIDGTSSCPSDFHSYFVKLVEVPSQERKKQSLSNRSSTLCHCHGKRARVAKSKELEVVSIGLDAQ